MESITASDLVKEFIFDDEIQSLFESINNNLLEYNILEITGMGSQEIKHSNILGWFFEDSEHNLEYKILEGFLKKVIYANEDCTLQNYLYLAKYKKNITVYREKDNIDLLIVDEANHVLFVIENKLFANERLDGDDGGQLQKYEDVIASKFSNEYTKYFIYLTIDLLEASRDNWLKASHEMITETLLNISKHSNISSKTEMLFESYIDTLKRNGIVEDKELKDLCLQIWENTKYRKALETINNYKPDIFNQISEYLQNKLEKDYSSVIDLDESNRTYIRFCDKSWKCPQQTEGVGWTGTKKVLLYEFQNSTSGLVLKLIIGPSQNSTFRQSLFDRAKQQKDKKFMPGNTLSLKWNQIWKKQIISRHDINEKTFEELVDSIEKELETFFAQEDSFKKIHELFKDLMI